jgi:hypothetical protein
MERRGEGAKCPPGELQEDGCRRSLAEGQEDESGGTRAEPVNDISVIYTLRRLFFKHITA